MSEKTTLISAQELAALVPDDVLIVDCRFDLTGPDKGRREFAQGHIPGARYASLDRDLSDLSRMPEGLGRHPLPSVDSLRQALVRWGWQPERQVVTYDAAGGALAAARLWWLLRLAGVAPVAVLDGGYQAWLATGQSVATDEPEDAHIGTPDAANALHFDASQVLLDADQLAAEHSRVLLDARAGPRYRGEVEPLDRAAGHVPGALNRPFSENLQADGRFKPHPQLREEFYRLLQQHAPADVVHMCGSGVTACHNLLAMEHAGLTGSRLYAPSWSGWVSDPARPVATGASDGSDQAP